MKKSGNETGDVAVRGGSRVHGLQEASMRACVSPPATYHVLNKGCEWKVVKEVGVHLPHVGAAILAQAFVVEAVAVGPKQREFQQQTAAANSREQQRAYTCVIWRDSWLPRRMKMRFWKRTLRVTSNVTVST